MKLFCKQNLSMESIHQHKSAFQGTCDQKTCQTSMNCIYIFQSAKKTKQAKIRSPCIIKQDNPSSKLKCSISLSTTTLNKISPNSYI